MIPLVIEQFLLMSVGMADTVMVTTAGEAAVSGVSLVDNINFLIIQVFAALGTGGTVVVAQYLGRKEPENARVAAKQLLYAVTIVSTILMALALLFRHQILSLLFGTIEPEVLDSALSYFIATALAYPFMALYNAGSALFRSMGNSKVSMFNSLLINIINIVVNAILIFGFGMGALGAGIGTLVSRIVAAVLIIVLLQHENCPLRVERLFHPEFHRHIIQRILMIGIPNGLENSLFQVGKLMVLRLITSLDAIALAAAAGTVAVGSAVTANAIAGSIAGVANVPGAAMGLAMITVVGQCVGAREVEQAVRYTRKLLTVAYLSVGTLCIIEFFVAAPLVGMFHLSAETAAMAVTVLQWCAVFTVFFWPLAFTLPNALRASGDAMFTMCVSLFSMFAFRIALSYVLASAWGFDMGLLGVWVAMFVD
ncbi:MAG: MATE family efflux transporter, partial [Pseudoflavonifractor sp.]